MADEFKIERFDPNVVDGEDKQDNQEKILKRLQKKISKKRKLEEDKNKQPENEEKEVPEKKRKKKEKKKKISIEDSGFTPLGEHLQTTKKKVTRVLPYWLLNPDVAEIDYLSKQLPVKEMPGLDDFLTDKLERLGFMFFFPVQRQIIPILLKKDSSQYYRPNDVCVSAPTGSGKTLAFVLPIVQSLKSRMVPKVRALVVLPTQDLALQVYKVFNVFCEGSGLKVKLLSGQQSVAQEQADLFRVGRTGILHQLADILVVTPGRLVHHIRDTKQLDLTALRYLVIDEADRMILNISDDWLNVLESAVYSGGRNRPGPLNVVNARKRELPLQKLLFSATLGQDPEKLEQINLFEPKLFRCVVPSKDLEGKVDPEEISVSSIPAEVQQFTVQTEVGKKPLLVSCIVDQLKLNSVLVFTKSNESTHRLSLVLSNLGYSCGELSSDIKLKRKKILSKLRNGKLNILVCSDALARGIDVENLDAVISYDAPQYLNTYIHRVGRTGRAGKKGTAVTLLEPNQVRNFSKMLNEGGVSNVETMTIDNMDTKSEDLSKALEQTKRQLQQEMDEARQSKSKQNLQK